MADAQAEALARNAQVINAMGMLNEGVLQWGRDQASALTVQIAALDRGFWISGAFAVPAPGRSDRNPRVGRLPGARRQPDRRNDDRGVDHCRARAAAARGHDRGLAKFDAYARVPTSGSGPRSRHCKTTSRACVCRGRLGRLTVEKVLYLPPGTKEPVLNGINFELQPGESLAIVGPSGSGKSTLARILVGCLFPTAGKVRLDGTELRNWDRRQFGEYTGYLPQEVELFPGSIKENVCRMRSDLADEEIYDAATLAGVHDMICHLPQRLRDRAGAQRRAALGRPETAHRAWRAPSSAHHR